MKKQSRVGEWKPRDERLMDIIGAVYHHRMVQGYNGITPHAVAKKLGVKNIHHIRKLCYLLVNAGLLADVDNVDAAGRWSLYLYPKSLNYYYQHARPTYDYLRSRFGRQLPLPEPVGQVEEME